MPSFSLISLVSMQYQLVLLIAVFHVGSVDAVVSHASDDSLVLPAVFAPTDNFRMRSIVKQIRAVRSRAAYGILR